MSLVINKRYSLHPLPGLRRRAWNNTRKPPTPRWRQGPTAPSGAFINPPTDPVAWSRADISLIAANCPGRRANLSIWPAALRRPSRNTGVTPTSTRPLLDSAHRRASPFRAPHIGAAQAAVAHLNATNQLAMGDDFGTLGTAAKIRRLAILGYPIRRPLPF